MPTVANILTSKGYTIIGEPQTGGFAIVYKAKHKDGHIRAFKTPNLSLGLNEDAKARLKADFANECKKLLELHVSQNVNPYIIKLYDYETRQSPYYAEMDYFNGPSLRSYVESHYLPIRDVYKFIMDIGSALAFCHHHTTDYEHYACLIHNDLHPANICYNSDDGHFYLFDFGFSMRDSEPIRSSRRDKGWCEYLAPERCEMYLEGTGHLEATPRWDIYSFGCLIYLVLTGNPPFSIEEYRNDITIAEMHKDVDAHKPWTTIRARRKAHFNKCNPGKRYKDDCPSWLIDMVGNCLSREPKDRYMDGNAFMHEFTLFMQDPNRNPAPRKGILPEEVQQLRGLQRLVGIMAMITLFAVFYAYRGDRQNPTVMVIPMYIMCTTFISFVLVAFYHYFLINHKPRWHLL